MLLTLISQSQQNGIIQLVYQETISFMQERVMPTNLAPCKYPQHKLLLVINKNNTKIDLCKNNDIVTI